jgi:pimeloyl-ACP methyl ester carboxylesterase
MTVIPFQAIRTVPVMSAGSIGRVDAEPQRDSTIRLSDGRRLAFAEWGPPDGIPVIVLYGTPGSRLFCADVDATEALGVRLIAIDRPGYGLSDPRPGLTVPDVADDLAELHAVVSREACPVFGWSDGGPYAFGFAAIHQDRVSAVGVAGSWGPLRQVPGVWEAIPLERRDLLDLAARDPQSALPHIRAATQWYAEDPERIVDALEDDGNPDYRLHQDPKLAAAMRRWFREGARQGTAGFVDDWIATYARDWDFALTDVNRPTRIWWGDGDRITSEEHARYLSEQIPGAALTVFAGEGHLAPVLHWAEILSALLAPTVPYEPA